MLISFEGFIIYTSPPHSNACWLLVHSAAPRGHINHSLVFCGDGRGEGAPLSRSLEQMIQLNNKHFLHCNPGNLFTLQSLLHCMASWGSDKVALLNPQETLVSLQPQHLHQIGLQQSGLSAPYTQQSCPIPSSLQGCSLGSGSVNLRSEYPTLNYEGSGWQAEI